MKNLEQQIEKGLELLEEAMIQERLEVLEPQLQEMRDKYSKLERVDPCGEAHKKLRATVQAMSLHDLQVLYAAEIKWLSYEAGWALKCQGIIKGAVDMKWRA